LGKVFAIRGDPFAGYETKGIERERGKTGAKDFLVIGREKQTNYEGLTLRWESKVTN